MHTTTITGARRRDDTIQRVGGHGDNWYLSWASDDSQFIAMCDGLGVPGVADQERNSRLYRMTGAPPNLAFAEIPGFPELRDPVVGQASGTRYYGFGTLAIGDRVYQYLSTYNKPSTADADDLRFVGVNLIYSPDNGSTWHNQDGSSPVVWEDWNERSTETMVFYQEDGDAFSLISILQMGKAYGANVDGYVYGYAPNGNTEGSMNQLVLFRVPTDRVLDRGSYEYFQRREADGSALWTREIADRGVVHTFPAGHVNTYIHPYAWMPSIVFNEPLGLYLMASWGDGTGEAGYWFSHPSYLGMWFAENPWGPWIQFHEDESWTPDGEVNARCYQPQIVPRWISEDGRSIWLLWTDFQPGDPAPLDSLSEVDASASPEFADAYRAGRRAGSPYYAINIQRVDLDVSKSGITR
jgi:hypothetical protein